ncbi:type IX secretion system membrane protein PorP/SprF [Fulvivirgaceae bacterium PWU4]|uniref:Type IX secretion system membrane protein PorP/SprF n=1 Tax=Chryseosolibacter histidini TaxID=2782349 RepID=A0AAP2GKF2_9BACT|nr:type IX secretion system membrane protein PorP/SprF [Chryseosolibacter histidini]MBT1699261.1 type IX secretion system membrane protein PorP/SprF [Chryseosolibacter histidini]
MIKTTRLVLLLIFFQAMAQAGYGQQRVSYAQYMFNGLMLNPAYAGTDKYPNITAQGRQQWLGAKGAPNSQMLSAHMPWPRKRIGVGIILEKQGIGVTDIYNGYVMYSYKIKVNRKNVFSMGIQAGVTTYREQLTDLTLPSGSQDPSFAKDITYTLPNFGAGVYYYSSSQFYVGLSVPSIAQNTLKRGNPLTSKEARQYLLTGGYLWNLRPHLKFKPNFLLKVVNGAPMNLDINLNFLFDEVLWLGCSFQLKNAVNPMVELQATQKLRIGFSYDIPVSSLTESGFRSGSPEVMLNYRFVKLLKNRVVSPRYF